MLTKLAGRSHLMIATTLLAAGCADLGDDASATDDHAVNAENGLAFNGLAFNGFSANGLAFNGLAFNGLAFNGLAFNGLAFNGLAFNGLAFNGLSLSGNLPSTSGLMTTPGGRDFVNYLVRVAYPVGHSLTKQDQYGNSYTFEGSLGVAPEAEFGTCDVNCQEKISGALLAHVNNSGLHVGIWLVGPDNGIGWGSDPNFPYQEAAYFGNLFAADMPSNYCAGKNLAAANVKGRLGNPWGNNSAVFKSPFGWQWDSSSNQNLPASCTLGCTALNEGFSQCTEPNGGRTWSHPVTVYRNFESTQLYKICNKNGGKCLGVVNGSIADGANVEQRTFTGAAGQTWQVVQVTPGKYKIINKTSGMALAVPGTSFSGNPVVQKPYTGAANQIVPLTYILNQPGFANLTVSSSTAVFWTNWSTLDGALITTVDAGQNSADAAKWTFTAVSSAAIDPGRTYRLSPQNAPSSSLDIAGGSQTNGTPVQLYTNMPSDTQKLYIRDAGTGNAKLTMKANQNKCIGPVGGAAAAGARLEIQDCNGSSGQAWLTGETAAGSGVFALKNAGNPNLCLNVTGGSTANGARMEMNGCSGASSQRFAVQLLP